MKRYRLVLVDCETGIVLNQAGRYHCKGQPRFEPSFDDESEALASKDDLLALFPWADVSLKDAGDAGRATTFQPPTSERQRFFALARAYRTYWFASPLCRVFMKSPSDPWDPSSYRGREVRLASGFL